MSGQLVSPLSTGGSGVIFEYQVGAIMLSRLLRGAHVPIGIQRPLSRVGFQQRNFGFSFDDIVAHAQSDSPDNTQSIQIQVKKRIHLTGGNPTLVEVMAAGLEVCHERATELADGTTLLGLAAAEPTDQLAQLSDLAKTARAHTQAETFAAQFQEGIVNSKTRNLYGHIRTAVARAATTEDSDALTTCTHLILARLHVWHVPEGPDSTTWRAELDGLADMASTADKSPTDLMAHLYTLAEEFGPRGGLIDADHVRRQLHSQYGIQIGPGSTSSTRHSPLFTINQSGSGTVFAAEKQVFNGLTIGNKEAVVPDEESEP